VRRDVGASARADRATHEPSRVAPSRPTVGVPLRVLVACERSGVVRRAFRALGHNAWSCDLEPADDGSRFHIQGDAIAAAYRTASSGRSWWDLLIFHAECTYLANSGAKHLYAGMNKVNGPNPERWARMGAAALFFKLLLDAPVERVAGENPIMLGYPKEFFGISEPTQIIQPWQHGHGETKATGLWLKRLPPLRPTNIVEGREQRVWRMGPGENRKRDRSRTFDGIAAAMAEQWGGNAIADTHPEGGDGTEIAAPFMSSGGAKQSPNTSPRTCPS
jgi:hypothetical protein